MFSPILIWFYNHKDLIVPSIFTKTFLFFILAQAKSISWALTILWYFSFVVTKPSNGQLMGTPSLCHNTPKNLCASSLLVIFSFMGKFLKYNFLVFIFASNKSSRLLGISTLSPTKLAITSIIFLQLFIFIMYGHHILDYFCLF